MTRLIFKASAVLIAFALIGASTGCGGPASSSAGGSSAAASGLETPASVSVVNATN